ncbi:Glycine betaine transport ATP-binding protein OpuAA [compost metagenome]
MRERGISNLFVIDRSMRLLGVITAEDASEANKSGKTLSDILISDSPQVSPDTVLSDLFEATSSAKVPLAVVDEQRRLLGVIVRGAVLGALAGDMRDMEVKQHELHS